MTMGFMKEDILSPTVIESSVKAIDEFGRHYYNSDLAFVSDADIQALLE